MQTKKYPYENLLLENLKGEKWKDIPELEGYYLISNFGRIKRLAYQLEFCDGRVYQKKSMINKPTLAKSPNHYRKDHIYFLRGNVRVARRAYNFSVARILYYCFIKKFDLKNTDLMIICQDGNGRNVSLSNLQLVDRSERQLRMIRTKRSENVLLRPEVRQLTHAANSERLRKRVAQYNRKGKQIAIFDSVVIASNKTGITISSISMAARGIKPSAGGFLWSYNLPASIDVKVLMDERKKNYKNGLRKQVTQYNLQSNKIATYPSLMAAQHSTGILATLIGAVVNGHRKTAGGFFWKGENTAKANSKK